MKIIIKIIIAGSRTFTDYVFLKSKMDEIVRGMDKTKMVVVSGHARGADYLGERWARENGIEVEQHPARWDTYGKAAGPIRNQEMADSAGSEGMLVAFPIGDSKGTMDMIRRAKRKGMKVIVYRVEA